MIKIICNRCKEEIKASYYECTFKAMYTNRGGSFIHLCEDCEILVLSFIDYPKDWKNRNEG